MDHRRVLATLSLFVCLPATASLGQEWTRFRGPNGSGISDAKTVPTDFASTDANWAIELPGGGHSQPVLWGSALFVTSAPADGAKRFLSRIDTDKGTIVWTKELESAGYATHARNAFASSTPAVDANRVYAAFQHGKEARLHVFDHEGGEVWKHDLGEFASQHGFGGSPIVHDDTVVFPVQQLVEDGHESPSYVIALDAPTGTVRWRTPRPSRRTAYGTPCVFESDGGQRSILFTSGAGGIYALDAKSGAFVWGADVFDKRTCSSPIVTAGLVFGTCGSGGGGNYLVAVRPDGRGDVTATHVVYTHRRAAPYVPTGIAKDGRVYLWSDAGIVSCLEARTGAEMWQGRVGGDYSASPVWIDGRIYNVSHDGEIVIIGTGDALEVVGRTQLGELCRTTPAVAGGKLYVRTERKLYSFGGKKLAASK